MTLLTSPVPAIRLLLLSMVFTLTACSDSQQDSLYESALNLMRSAAQLEVKQHNVGDVDMTYMERAGHGPVMLLLHGFSADKDNWVKFARHIDDSYRLIIPDLAGHGDTPAPDGEDYGLVRQAERLKSLMGGLNIKQFHIAGNSMGGAISAIYTILYPDDIVSLTLIDAAGVDAPNPNEFSAALAQGKNPLIATDEDSFEFRMNFTMSQPPFLPWPLRPAMMRKTLARADINRDIFQDLLATQKELKDSGFAQQLSEKITVPTLIVWGKEDRVLDVSAVEIFKEKIPQAQIKIYDDVGHLPMVEIPADMAELYSNFVTSIR